MIKDVERKKEMVDDEEIFNINVGVMVCKDNEDGV